MEQMDSTIKAAGFTLMIVIIVVLVWRYRDPWHEEFESKFKRALASLNISDHELIIDRVISPRGGHVAEVYRILRDPDDRYFLFMQTGDSPGILKPLTKERALLAAKLSGFGQAAHIEPISPNEGSWTSGSESERASWGNVEGEPETTQDAPPVPTGMRSTLHTVLVKLCLYLVIWPNIILTSIFTIVGMLAPPVLMFVLIGWWGLGIIGDPPQVCREVAPAWSSCVVGITDGKPLRRWYWLWWRRRQADGSLDLLVAGLVYTGLWLLGVAQL
ncbi:hypothetical protein [Pseudomonas abietaniphila]|uniref:Uncharacterized protein n=1 Tax=Pseudomonas abietaniphila TaxID=89065 RepID=A0A1G8PUT6_9PSED|nr:hypothetical protein [Pseudomonas abietaniphila]SDI96319.1 hypothetical protein SAMN05216605_119121 [Pseudomonas abietaniphila]